MYKSLIYKFPVFPYFIILGLGLYFIKYMAFFSDLNGLFLYKHIENYTYHIVKNIMSQLMLFNNS